MLGRVACALPRTMATLESLNFDNLSLRSLPVDPIQENYTREVRNACFSRVKPTPLDRPEVVAVSQDALALLGLDAKETERPEFAEYFGGNRILPGSEPAAHCYCGHQFGYFSGQLGDGATMYLGEVVNPAGERWELQFKGAGQTPYSRQGDGRKVLRSSIREFLCSEAMHHLGVPTTRAGTVVTSATRVVRDVFYSGDPKMEKATVITRIAPTFLRFGSFEIFKSTDSVTQRRGPSAGNVALLSTLTEHVENTFYKEICGDKQGEERHLAFFREVCVRTARLAAEWQCVGFCHGVLNTDNMSIVGVTIDYGPFGFVEAFDPQFICNGSDNNGRYTYEAQPSICRWNLRKLAEALSPLLPLSASEAGLKDYDTTFAATYMARMRQKLGLVFSTEDGDLALIKDLLGVMAVTRADFTNTFRTLAVAAHADLPAALEALAPHWASLEETLASAKAQISPEHFPMLHALYQQSPRMLESFGLSAVAIEGELARRALREELKDMDAAAFIRRSQDRWRPWLERYRARIVRDTQAAPAGSGDAMEVRTARMHAANPAFVLRNFVAQQAIERAEQGDYSEVRRVLQRLRMPYDDVDGLAQRPAWARGLCVT